MCVMVNLWNILGEKQEGESIKPMTSVSDCLQLLTQCHRTIYEQDAPRFAMD